jgi:hypothetical protein
VLLEQKEDLHEEKKSTRITPNNNFEAHLTKSDRVERRNRQIHN